MKNNSNSMQPDIIEQYQSLVKLRNWEQARVVIEEIIERSPSISTSWYNYGTILDELEKYSEAARVFEHAFELDPEDFGAEYRMFRSLHLAKEHDTFFVKLKQVCEIDPDFIEHFLDDPDFSPLFEHSPFKELALAYKNDGRIGG